MVCGDPGWSLPVVGSHLLALHRLFSHCFCWLLAACSSLLPPPPHLAPCSASAIRSMHLGFFFHWQVWQTTGNKSPHAVSPGGDFTTTYYNLQLTPDHHTPNHQGTAQSADERRRWGGSPPLTPKPWPLIGPSRVTWYTHSRIQRANFFHPEAFRAAAKAFDFLTKGQN